MMNRNFVIGTALAVVFALGLSPVNATPILHYTAETGNVQLEAGGSVVLSFNLQSDGRFIPPLLVADLQADTFDVPGLKDDTPSVMGWVSALAAGGQGFNGAGAGDTGFANLGNIFPANLTQNEFLGSFLTAKAWAGPGGTGGDFGLNFIGGGPVIPEPTTLAMFSLASIGLVVKRRRTA